MTDIAVKVENLGKLYRIGQIVGYSTLRESLMNVASAPFRWLRRTEDRRRETDSSGLRSPVSSQSPVSGPPSSVPGHGNFLWALKDVSFEVKHGEAVGIIGRNGSGKTTILKILSRITAPTEGSVEICGRVGSLLEVGTGFHPELTGRENIYLNGAVLGMKRAEVKQKFDEIVAFSEIEKFLDTPVKRYSSGMYVRLAFAVAAHLEPEILIVDEVLAVGDAAFQKKCLGKMGDLAKGGRTVLFVSHNMGAVSRLCNNGLLLDQGKVVFSGDINNVIARYTESVMSSNAELCFTSDSNKKMQMRSLRLLDHTRKPSTQLDREYPFSVLIEYEVRERIIGAHIGVMLDKVDGTPICHCGDIDVAPGGIIDREPGFYRSIVEFPGGLLNAGAYQIRIGIGRYGGQIYDYCEAFVFYLLDQGSFAAVGAGGQQRPGVLAMPLKWETESISSL